MGRDGTTNRAEAVKAEARELGFHLVGITGAEALDDAETRTLYWLARDRQADMAWMTPERARLAARPAELLAGARSIIALGVSYRELPVPAREPRPGRGRIARYAGGDDYHDVMRQRMRALVEGLERRFGTPVRARLFVDSSPLSERAVAMRAGLGFFGKNSMLLAPGGSYYLLGAIVTDLDLEPDRPLLKDCGQCRLCLDACPTGALDDGHTIDAGRCISYLTIEHRGPIPPELRPAMGSWVFGCDICQEVCPWNHGHGPLAWPELAARPSPGLEPNLVELLELDAAGFAERFHGSPIKRAKRRGLLRNAAVVLGNGGDAAAIPALGRALSDVAPLVRGHAAWALGQLGGVEAARLLRAALDTEQDEWVEAELRSALQRVDPSASEGSAGTYRRVL